MRKVMLLAMALAVIIPASASAESYGSARSHVTSSFGIKIVVRDAPKVVRHHHRPIRHLRPQPVPRYFHHHAPRWRWHKSSRAKSRHFHRHDRGHRGWFRGPNRARDGGWRRGDHGPRHGGASRGRHHGRHGR